ncbi:hypothetical protein F5Y07DRAFT_404826 [Xylaria sp. FL0933]|nr:hypothetical protein F5Y07DRAFT_404826 [Xylaria sp. FL0933]
MRWNGFRLSVRKPIIPLGNLMKLVPDTPCTNRRRSVCNIGPRTASQRASEKDGELWGSSSSKDDYEQRTQALNEKRRLKRGHWMKKQSIFPLFSSLPPELCRHMWELAMDEPTTVGITTSQCTLDLPPRDAPCGTVF